MPGVVTPKGLFFENNVIRKKMSLDEVLKRTKILLLYTVREFGIKPHLCCHTILFYCNYHCFYYSVFYRAL